VGLIVLAVCLGLLGFAIVSISVGTGSSNQIPITGAAETQSLLGGIQQDGPRLGSSSAPVSIQVFDDLQCEPCADWQRDVIEPLIRGPVRDGDVQLIFRHFSTGESETTAASYGAAAAAKQDDEWQFVQLFFANQREAKRRGVTQEFMDNVSRAILNFNLERWQGEIDDPDVKETVEADNQAAAERRLPAEPAVVVGGQGGTRQLIESPSLEEIEAAIAQVR
jgi:protein-disulfide isomerase